MDSGSLKQADCPNFVLKSVDRLRDSIIVSIFVVLNFEINEENNFIDSRVGCSICCIG